MQPRTGRSLSTTSLTVNSRHSSILYIRMHMIVVCVSTYRTDLFRRKRMQGSNVSYHVVTSVPYNSRSAQPNAANVLNVFI